MKELPKTDNAPKVDASYEYHTKTKTSDWGLLNPIFLGRVALCDKEGKAISGSSSVTSIVTEGDMAIEADYSTPFENSNPENKLPTLMGMVQAGDWVNSLDNNLGSALGLSLSEETKNKLNSLEGRSNFTKINSTQIYLSNQPVKINATLFFEAWADALHEVENQLALLQQWALPAYLSDKSLVSGVIQDTSIESLFPSKIPPFVSFSYAKKRYAPLFLVNVGAPLVAPMDKNGNRILVEVTVSFISRNSWDKNDLAALYK
ncbi:hypothetical protein HCY58_11815 [Acinetobacter radioresistens]|uniref:hypothetical protein n=1 Tax=Acinetobacter radioresistens TaxID=40216 RepID=UPI0020058A99|nr:hypothetical protein [Acinetobacter radioresistens]MCK4087733.1 hypothetical protein [Acinetobacter radioresistens]MCK4093482.1 hypothetical protein [Acinetobacter radioresistens]